MDIPANSRRGFVNLLLGSGFGAMMVSVLYPVVRYLIPPASGEPTIANVTIPWKPPELRANSGRIFRFGSQPGLLIRTPAGELRAFSAVCFLPAPILGHVGDGNFHCAILADTGKPEELAEAERLNSRIVARALAMDGTCTGEHGVGMHKMESLRDEHGDDALDLMALIKRSFDPLGILNPGKILHV